MNTLSFLLVVQFIGFSYFANATASLYMELPKRIERAYYMSPDLRFKVNSANDYSILDTKENNEIVCDNHILRGAEIQWSRDNLFGAISLPINGKRSVYIVDVRNHTCSLKYTGSNSVTLGKFSLDSLTYAFTVPNKNELYVNNLSSNTKHKLELVHNLREEKVAQITNDDIFLVESSTYSKPSRVVIIDRKTFQQVGEFTGVPFLILENGISLVWSDKTQISAFDRTGKILKVIDFGFDNKCVNSIGYPPVNEFDYDADRLVFATRCHMADSNPVYLESSVVHELNLQNFNIAKTQNFDFPIMMVKFDGDITNFLSLRKSDKPADFALSEFNILSYRGSDFVGRTSSRIGYGKDGGYLARDFRGMLYWYFDSNKVLELAR